MELKRFIASEKLDKAYRKFSHYLYHETMTGELLEDYDAYKCEYDKVESNGELKRVIHNLNNSRKYRIKKCKDFITDMFNVAEELQAINMRIAFLTLTFNDNVLYNSNERARRVKVNRYLKSVSHMFVANIDFGKETEREHYHAIVMYNDYEKLLKWEKNGFIKIKPVRNSDKSIVKLSAYINKLTYHAIKDTTQHDNTSYRLIYWTNKSISDIIKST